MSKPSRAPLCVYCGNAKGTTTDHVVPKCLFFTRPSQWVTVPACPACNEGKAKHDLLLRDYLSMDIAGSRHPEAQANFSGPLSRALKRNQSELARVVKFTYEVRPLYSRGGLYLGDYPMATFDHEPLRQCLAYIARGLYWDLRKVRIPDDYQFQVGRIDFLRARETWQTLGQQPNVKKLYMGQSVFACLMQYATEDPFVTLWLLGFYDSVVFMVSTEQPSSREVEG